MHKPGETVVMVDAGTASVLLFFVAPTVCSVQSLLVGFTPDPARKASNRSMKPTQHFVVNFGSMHTQIFKGLGGSTPFR
jgi:flavin reductase (DIM6/NTAB) family NADH-FMN oxidoreductase RutF